MNQTAPLLDSHDYGEVLESGAVRFTRLLPGPVARVWRYITEPDLRAKWLAGGPMELRLGGKVALEFWNDQLSAEADPTPTEYCGCDGAALLGRITALEPPRLLAFTWGEDGSEGGQPVSEVTFELSEQPGGKVLLVLTHRRLTTDLMRNVGPGWHTHLDTLVMTAEGRRVDSFWQRFLALRAYYSALIK
ncbi:SRPBCC family protein [Ferrovibrio sp. MS7]|uniref:SRPBCC family protein n=1 Tax=Ferrovibrio plantarum TaxID=3119164 RepID=UPI0031349CB6